MKKNQASISLIKLAKIQSQQDILLCTLGQKTMDNITSTNEGERTHPRSLSTVLNALYMEEAKSGHPPFLLPFEIFKYNIHNYLGDSGVATNIMLPSIAKKINAQCIETSAWIIKLDKTSVPSICELWYVIIWLSHENRVQQCVNKVFVNIPEAYDLLLSRDWSNNLDKYFSIDQSHMWVLYKGKRNQI